MTLSGHIRFEWRGRNRLLQTSKGMSQLLSCGCRPTIPDVRSQFCTVYFLNQLVNSYLDDHLCSG